MAEWRKGIYKVINPEKYIGEKPPIYRSSWEARFCHYLDTNDNVQKWGSECLVIPYYNPIDGKNHRYFPDFFCQIKKKDGTVVKYVVEVKPLDQAVAPKLPKRRTTKALENYRQQQAIVLKNKFKWEAAEEFCKQQGYIFKVITEKELMI